jgi:hypothetical protein
MNVYIQIADKMGFQQQQQQQQQQKLMCVYVHIQDSSYITTDGQSASLSWCQAPISDH